jgi:hypothetical protein
VTSEIQDPAVTQLIQDNIDGCWKDPHDQRLSAFGATDAKLIILGHVSEVCRCFYYKDGLHPPAVDAALLAALAGYRDDRYAEAAFEEWLAGVPRDANINTLDLFYWESRVGTWSSMCCTALDTFAEVLSPYNCRALLEAGLSTEVADRRAPHLLHREICRIAAADTLRMPFNHTFADTLDSTLGRVLPWRLRQRLKRALR